MNEIIKTGYDKIADSYHLQRMLKKVFTNQYFENLSSYFPHTGKLLDLGCGGGQPVTAYFSDKGYKITGVDISSKMIEIAREQIPKGHFIVSDMLECNFSKNEFDVIVSTYAIIHVPQQNQKFLFEKMYEWLKPNGVAYLTLGHENTEELLKENWHGVKMYWSFFGPEQYNEILQQVGFKLLWHEIESLPNQEKFYNVIVAKK